MISQRFSSSKHWLVSFGLFLAIAALVAVFSQILGEIEVNLFTLTGFLLISALVLDTLLFIILSYTFYVFMTLEYVLTRQSLQIRSGFLCFHIPLNELKILKQHKNMLPHNEGNFSFLWFWTHFPSADALAISFRGRHIFITPKNPVQFTTTLYRILKVSELEKKVSMTDSPVEFNIHSPLRPVLDWLLDSQIRVCLLLDIVTLFSFGAFVFWTIPFLPKETVLQYSLIQGILLQGPREMLFYSWGGLIFLFFVCILTGYLLFRREKLAAVMTLSAFPFITLLMSVYVYSLIQISG
jgi:hypothetical protein